ncbi:L-lactate dehydrogenase-like [Polistes fuscatus]|uniref:L-lactate dehydrogenase-like n=1 Tax=Polistes fuscatus TaxID=30207 RepID=UPI001CA7E50A|nr:L-lactate dehydrogenase-like [Polistes fuscatus]
MVLTLQFSSSFLRVCLKNWEYVTSKRNLGINRGLRNLPPTIFKNILNGKNNGKRIESASFTEDASCGSDKQRTDLQPMCLREELLCKVSEPVRDCCHKVSIVGAGMVGIGVATALLFQKITSHIAIVDAFPKKLEGEGMDISHGSVLIGDPRIDFDTDFCITSNSKVVIVCAGVRQEKGESRLDLTKRNTDIIKTIIPSLLSFSPNAVFVVASNPVDILSWVTWKASGLPFHRIIGSGTYIDTCRFRYLISDRLGIAPSSVNAYIIGEHGDSQVPLWSGVNVAGVQFRDIIPNIGLETDEEKWHELSKEVIGLGATVRCLKGYTNIGIGLCVADIVNAILGNAQRVITVSTMIQGHFDICHEMYLSLPCVIGEHGVTKIVRQRMTEFEKKLFQSSANIVYNVQKDIKL